MGRRTVIREGPSGLNAVTPGARSRPPRELVHRRPAPEMTLAPTTIPAPDPPIAARAVTATGPARARRHRAAQGVPRVIGLPGKGSPTHAPEEAGAGDRSEPARTTVGTVRTDHARVGRVRPGTVAVVSNGATAEARTPTAQHPVRRSDRQEGPRRGGVPSCAGQPPAVGRRRAPLPIGSRGPPVEARRRRAGPTRDAIVPGSRVPRPERDSPPGSDVRPNGATPTGDHRIARRGVPAPSAVTVIGTRATGRKSPPPLVPTTHGISGAPTGRTGSVPRRSTRTSRATSSTG